VKSFAASGAGSAVPSRALMSPAAAQDAAAVSALPDRVRPGSVFGSFCIANKSFVLQTVLLMQTPTHASCRRLQCRALRVPGPHLSRRATA
jgi:hypothetical protein